MDECVNKFNTVLGERTNTIIITSPVKGILYCTAKDFTIIPRIVSEGDNEVVAVRHHKLVSIIANEVVGVVKKVR